MQIVRPQMQHVASYVAALQQGWSPDSRRGDEAAREELELLNRDVALYLDRLVDREAVGAAVVLPNGGVVFEQFLKPAAFGAAPSLRYRIALT